MKIKIILVFFVAAAIWVLSILIHVYEKKDSFKIENINLKSVDSIRIFDRGIVGGNSVLINNKDSLNRFDEIISNSKAIDEEKLNMKDNNGLCDIIIYSRKGKSVEIALTATDQTGGIISSGDYFYRNDELLRYVTAMFDIRK